MPSSDRQNMSKTKCFPWGRFSTGLVFAQDCNLKDRSWALWMWVKQDTIDTTLIDVIIAASGSMSGLMLIRPASQWKGGGTNLSCLKYINHKSHSAEPAWAFISKPKLQATPAALQTQHILLFIFISIGQTSAQQKLNCNTLTNFENLLSSVEIWQGQLSIKRI